MKKLFIACFCIFIPSICFAGGTVTLSKYRDCSQNNCLDTYRWDFVEADGAAEDTTATVDVYGKILGVKFIETSITAATTVQLLDGAGRDVLNGAFSDSEASATATDADHYRVPVDGTGGGHIIQKGPVYISVSSGSGTDTGAVEVYVLPYNALLP